VESAPSEHRSEAEARSSNQHFGEEGGLLSYGSYLQLDKLLSAQVLESDPPAHDELLFITIHQVYELWFKQLLHELETARDLMLKADDLWTPRHLLDRAAVIERVLVAQVDVLETMTPQDFLAFREYLNPASGFQSVQYRELEFLSGLKDERYLDRLRSSTSFEAERLRKRLSEPTLWDGFLAVLAATGLSVDDLDARTESLRRVSADRGEYGAVWDLAEGLLNHDQMAAQWRARHVVMVERQIGGKTGTGGSTGVEYLRSRLEIRYYPELWALRSAL
jgi:tryptophan 2,3-dioxygenase